VYVREAYDAGDMRLTKHEKISGLDYYFENIRLSWLRD